MVGRLVEIRLDPGRYAAFYRADSGAVPAAAYPGYLVRTREGTQLRFDAAAKLPEPLATIGKVSKSNDQELQGRIVEPVPPAVTGSDTAVVPAGILFEPVQFVKLNAIAAAALDFAKTAAQIALGSEVH